MQNFALAPPQDHEVEGGAEPQRLDVKVLKDGSIVDASSGRRLRLTETGIEDRDGREYELRPAAHAALRRAVERAQAKSARVTMLEYAGLFPEKVLGVVVLCTVSTVAFLETDNIVIPAVISILAGIIALKHSR